VQPPSKPVTFAGGPIRKIFQWINATVTVTNLLGAGVIFYMAAGTALGLTYLANQK
jgi:hypothetical protein